MLWLNFIIYAKIKMKDCFKNSYGFSLVELVVAMAILMLIVFAFTPLLLGSVDRIFYAGDKSEALYEGQADMEVKIVERETIDGYEIVMDFGNDTIVTVPGGFIEVEQSRRDARAWISTFLPYVPSIRLSDSFLIEGYETDYQGYPIVIMGMDTKLNEDDFVYIYTREGFEQGLSEEYKLNFDLIERPDHIPPGYDEYALFYLPAGLTNANSHYMTELKWDMDEIEVKVRARLQIMLPFAVAVGQNGTIVVSPDAIDVWNTRSTVVNLSGISINDVIWADFRYIAVTSNGKVLIWGNQEEPQLNDIPGIGSVSLNSLAYGNGNLVAVGDNGTIAVSGNGGISWVTETLVVDAEESEEVNLIVNLNAVSWNGSEFMVVGHSGTAITSNNGTDWVYQTIDNTSVNFYGVSYGNSIWVAVGDAPPADPAADPSRRYIIYSGLSANSLEERKFDDSGGSRLNDVSYSVLEADSDFDPKYIAVGNKGLIMTSEDGISWSVGMKTSAHLNSVFWDRYINEQFIITGSIGTIVTGDWNSWTVQTSDTSNNLKGVAVRWEN